MLILKNPRLIFRLLFGRRLPITSGAIKADGISAPVTIRRDNYGIPYIEAQTDEDAWYALGFCQGQDRAFQLEGYLRVVRGTLSAIAGAEALPVDRLSRRIGFHRSAEEQLKAFGDYERGIIEAFARGVTEGVRVGSKRKAHEFVLLRSEPTPFEAADVIGVQKLLSFALGSNWDMELARLKILQEDGEEALKALDTTYPEWQPVTTPPDAIAGKSLDALAEDLDMFTAHVGKGGGSNNWAIAPNKTATGRPILASDPHLEPNLPPYWYLAHIRTPDWAMAGASFAGAPAIAVGHNGTIAWGVTAGLADNTDLFLEQVSADGKSVQQGGEFIPCEVRREVIEVKGKPSVVEDVLITPHGPVVGPAFDGFDRLTTGGDVGAVSMSATWLNPRPIKAFLHLHKVRTFEEFREAFSEWPFAAFNMAYADVLGNIGWQFVGDVPKRRKGYGTLPLPGWDAEVGWESEPVPYDEMPYTYNPESGYIATANNQPMPTGEGPFLGMDWIEGYRCARIMESLKGRSGWSVADSQKLQLDLLSIPWREMRDIVLNAPVSTDDAKHALALLKSWDGVVSADSVGASVFEFFTSEMLLRMMKSKAPRSYEWALGKGFTPLVMHSGFAVRRIGQLIELMRNQPEGWFNRSWPDEIADALAEAVKRLRACYGSDASPPLAEAWGQVRRVTLQNPVGRQKPLNKIFDLGPFPWGGDANTVGQASIDLLDPTANPIWTASLRAVIDVGHWENSRFILPGGQSGNPVSPHYDDMFPLWKDGEGVPIAWLPEKITEAAKFTLRLEPH